MGCLTERERIALEDIFLSISVNQSPFAKCKESCNYYVPIVKERAKSLVRFTKPRKLIPLYVGVKCFLRQNSDKLGNRMRFSRHR